MAIIYKKKHYLIKEPHYILKGKKVVKVYDLLEWGDWLENAKEKRVVKQVHLKNGIFISTVFIGIDMGWGQGKPVLFETMAFDENDVEQWQVDNGPVRKSMGADIYQVRYSTYAEAEKGHQIAVNKFKGRKSTRRVLHRVKRLRTGLLNGLNSTVGAVKQRKKLSPRPNKKH